MRHCTADLLLSFDIEEFDLPEEFGVPVAENDRMAVSVSGTERILNVLREKNVRATFFVTAFFAERAPELVARMVAQGHEIASHGLHHSGFEVGHLARSKKILETISGREVVGFRMARLAPVEKKDILAAGYVYESSLNPVWLPGRYNHLRAPLLPFDDAGGLRQYPVSAVPGLRIPLFWLSLKNFPFLFYRALARHTVKKTHYFNVYTHPWEYSGRAAEKHWRIPGYITRHAGMPMAERLGDLIDALRDLGDFRTFRENDTDHREGAGR
ncbi:MAG: polysaccharide deacetylase family protein [Victivallaceae bacterium]|nr:polysaccharide deacetylase family protein [Victivallaceae bacterium]